MGVTIPLPALDITKPAQAAPPDALAEFQRAAALQTEAARQQAISAQTTSQEQQNQMQAMQLKDEQLRRSLAPQFVQKDDSGKVTGFDNEGLYSAMLAQGADPMNIQKMRMSQVEMQKALLGLSSAKREQLDKMHSDVQDALETVQGVYNKESQPGPNGATSPTSVAPAPASPQSSLGPPVPGTGGMPAGMLPNMPEAQNIGKAPAGTPESLGHPNDGSAPTATESALQSSAENAPRPIGPLTQHAYQQQLMGLAAKGYDIGRFKPVLNDARDIEQAEAEVGSIQEARKNADELAKTQEAAGKGAQAQAEAEAALWKPAGEGTLVNFKTGQIIHGVASPDVEAFRAFVGRGGDPLQFGAFKAQQTAQATLPTDVAKATAIEVAKQNALAPELSQLVNTTRAGHQYINREDLPPGSAGVVEQRALQQGIPVVNKDTAGMLSDIDTAKANQDYMLQQIGGKLASDPTGRLYSAPANTIEKLAQTDPAMAAVGTYRNAAIQSMRAVAGSRGLRINQYEVQMAIDNDIPKLTDTLPVAQQKLANLKAFLDNTEQAHLVRNRAPGGTPSATPQSAGNATSKAAKYGVPLQ